MNHKTTNAVTITPLGDGSLRGTIQAAASKSSMQRACAAALIAHGKSIIRNPGHSNDDRAAMSIIENLGASFHEEGDSMYLSSQGVRPVVNQINCGESGLSIRMFTPLVALSDQEITINGTGSLVTRPMEFFDEILPQLGVTVKSNKGKLPLKIKGPLQPKTIEIDGSLSSQFLTGLLFAFAATNARDVSIKVNNLKSKPYIDLTLDVMRKFGLKLPENKNYEEFYFASADPGSQVPATDSFGRHRLAEGDARPPTNYTVEGDWSGGAFLLVAGAIAGPIVVKGLDVYSTQADKSIVQALIDSWVGISIQPGQIELRPKPMNAFHFNATDCPDLFPPLVALAAYCNGKTVIEGVSRLAHKESNRGITLQEEFGKMGIQIDLQGDLMIVHGGTGVRGAKVHSHHDHRIAMACAVAALKATGETIIEEANAVNKSYPDFFEHLKYLGAVVNENPVIQI